MPITSVRSRGLIYAGDTPLALSIVMEQTGPLQITVRAGGFTSTGQRRKDRAGGWLPWIEAPATFTLIADQVIDLTSDPTRSVAYDVDLIGNGTQTDVLVKRRIVGVEDYGSNPPGWTKVHELLYEFILPPACADISPLTIAALAVRPGFPPDTDAADWATQTGGA